MARKMTTSRPASALEILGNSLQRWQAKVEDATKLLTRPVRNLSTKQRKERAQLVARQRREMQGRVGSFGGDLDAARTLQFDLEKTQAYSR